MSDLLEQEKNRTAKAVEENPSGNREEICLLAPKGCIGVELGVATGQLSKRFLDLDHLGLLHSVDKWDDRGHPKSQHKAAVRLLQGYERSKVWRCTAQNWAKNIPDGSLGFIYIDCYAHTGQDDGTVLSAMWPKLQDGGIFSGDDYDKRAWPKTYAAVNRFAAEHERDINVRTESKVPGVQWHRFPTWWFRK